MVLRIRIIDNSSLFPLFISLFCLCAGTDKHRANLYPTEITDDGQYQTDEQVKKLSPSSTPRSESKD